MVLKRSLIILMLVLLPACSPERGDEEFFAPGGAGVPVIDAMMVVAKRFPDVYVTETLLPNQPFSYQAAGIVGAQVVVEWGDGLQTSYMSYTPGPIPGQYQPVTGNVVEANVTYHLTVTLPDNRLVRAATTTPDTLRVREWVLLDSSGQSVVRQLNTFEDFASDSLVYVHNQLTFGQGLLEARLENDPAVGYLVGLESLDLGSPLLIDTSFLDEEDLDSFTRSNKSPPFAPTQTNIRAPWFAIYYQGRYKVRVFKMDRNWYDLARTDPVLGGGGFGFGGEAGDNTVPPLFHVEGGVGLFGAMSSDSVGFYVNAP